MITMGSSTQKSATMSVQFALELMIMTSLMDSCSESGFVAQTHVTVGGGCAVIALTKTLMVCMCVKFEVPDLSGLYRLCMLCYLLCMLHPHDYPISGRSKLVAMATCSASLL